MTDFDFNSKLASVVSFLIFLWLITNYLINKIKSGEWKIPKQLEKFLSVKSAFSSADKHYKIGVVQREVLNDGTEFIVLGVNEKRLLLSRTINHGVKFLTDLEDSVEPKDTELQNLSQTSNQEEICENKEDGAVK